MTDTKSAGELADELHQWVEAIRAPNNSDLTINQIQLLNGECVSDAIEKAILFLRSLPQPGAGDGVREALANAIAKRFPALLPQYIQYTVADFVLTFFAPSALSTPTAAPSVEREKIAPVKCIEMVEFSSGFERPTDPEWRIEIGGYCANFPTETAANNFRNAILSLISANQPVARERNGGKERERCLAICEGWIGTFQDTEIKFTTAREYAVDAIEDIVELIRNGHDPRALAEQPRSEGQT